GAGLPKRLGNGLVSWIGGAHKLVRRNGESGAEVAEKLADAIGVLLGGFAGFIGGALDFGAVLVGARDIPNVVAFLAVVARQNITLDKLHGVADVRCAIGVGGSGGDVEFWHSLAPICYGSNRIILRLN